MDNQSFITLSKFTIEARKVIGTVNPARLLKDADYSEAVFEKVDASDNIELISLSLQLRHELGLLAPPTQNKEVMPDLTTEQTAPPSGKYLYGARG
ncbi:MAG TPA: hypothetical protein VIK69_01860 [Methylophilaceae bacterium]|jgi:hypothetical protein